MFVCVLFLQQFHLKKEVYKKIYNFSFFCWIVHFFFLSNGFRPSVTQSQAEQHTGNFYFLWASERTGFSQLYLYRFNSITETADCLCNGNPISCEEGVNAQWAVDSLHDVDESLEVIYFTANRDSSLQKHLYAVGFSQEARQNPSFICLTNQSQQDSWHEVTVSAKAGVFIDSSQSIANPVIVQICSLREARTLRTLHNALDHCSPALISSLQIPSIDVRKKLYKIHQLNTTYRLKL